MIQLNFTSFPILQTERLILREYAITDAPTLFAMRNNEEVMRYIDREKPQTIHDSELAIQTMAEGYLENKNMVWAITLKENPTKMIGSIGYYRTDFANYRAEIGYMLFPDHWRKGIVSEALRRTIAFGFDEIKLHSISANINPGNDASRQVLLRHGFVKEAYFREDYYFNGRFLDSEIYGLLLGAFAEASIPKDA
jgi:ribosomal-protein-alanine N-acetyltransferase